MSSIKISQFTKVGEQQFTDNIDILRAGANATANPMLHIPSLPAGENITAGNAICEIGGQYFNAINTDDTKINVVGFSTTTVTTGNSVYAIRYGHIAINSADGSNAIDDVMYLSGTSGKLTKVKPTTDSIVQVGTITNATTLDMIISIYPSLNRRIVITSSDSTIVQNGDSTSVGDTITLDLSSIRDEYNSGKTYAQNNLASYAGAIWRCLTNGTIGVTPALNNANWQMVTLLPGVQNYSPSTNLTANVNLSDDVIVCDTTNATITLTLPALSSITASIPTKQWTFILKAGSKLLSVNPSGSDTIINGNGSSNVAGSTIYITYASGIYINNI